MKKFLFILGVVIIAGGIFVGGLIVGNQMDFMNAMFQVNTIDKELVGLANHFHAVRYLDNGEISKAKNFLNDRVDGHVSTLGTFLDDCPNVETKAHAQKMLATIARHRQQFSAQRETLKAHPYHDEYVSHVDEILVKALNIEETEQDCSTVSETALRTAPER